MTDTTVIGAARPRWLTHPVRAWRTYQAALADRADAEAVAAGLTVEVLAGGMRCYRDPRLDQLAGHRRRQAEQAAAGGWSAPRLVVAGAGPAAPANGMTDRLRRAEPLAGAGAVPDPPLPHQAGCARSFPDGSAEKRYAGKHLPVRLDPGDPAGPVPGAPRSGAQNNAPARLPSGPANNTPGGAR